MREVWITWNGSRRSKTFARKLSCDYEEFDYPLPMRHLKASLQTITFLMKKKPTKIYIQYSFALLLILYVYKIFSNNDIYVVVDCHTKALKRKSKYLTWLFNVLKTKSFSACDKLVVTNPALLPLAKNFCANTKVVPDILPDIGESNYDFSSDYCVLINSFAEDEPIDNFLMAALNIHKIMKIYCTGKVPKKRSKSINKYRKIVSFTGFLDDNSYKGLIKGASLVFVLTKDDQTLLCGGYEALALGIPIITSDSKVIRNFFGDAAVYTNNTPDSIAKSFFQFSAQRKIYVHRIQDLSQKLKKREGHHISEVRI